MGLHIQSDLADIRRRQQASIGDQSRLANRDIAQIVYNAQQHERSSNPSSTSPLHRQEIVHPRLGGGNLQPLSDEASKPEFEEDSQLGKAKSTVVEDDGQSRSPLKRPPLPSTQLDQNTGGSQPGLGQSLDGGVLAAMS